MIIINRIFFFFFNSQADYQIIDICIFIAKNIYPNEIDSFAIYTD